MPSSGSVGERPPSGNAIIACTSESVKIPEVFISSRRTSKNSFSVLMSPWMMITPGMRGGSKPGTSGTSSKTTISRSGTRGLLERPLPGSDIGGTSPSPIGSWRGRTMGIEMGICFALDREHDVEARNVVVLGIFEIDHAVFDELLGVRLADDAIGRIVGIRLL